MLLSAIRQLHVRGITIALVLGLLLTSLAVAPAAADTDLGEQGTVGPHRLLDTRENPGAICRYDGSHGSWGYLITVESMSVRPPRVRATFDSQKVGWRILVQRSKDGSPWTTVKRSGVQMVTATTTEDAPFARMKLDFDAPLQTNRRFRAVVRMMWYRADGSLQGSSRHAVDRYRTVKFYGDQVQRGPCEGYEAAAV